MLNRTHFSYLCIAMLIVSFVTFAGCSKPPTEEMAKADKAVEDAKQKGAPLYVPDLFAKAEETLKKAKDFVTGKKYKEAKQAAVDAEAAAQQAIAGIDAAKAKMKGEAEQMVQDVQKAIDDLKANIASMAKKKALAKAREEAQAVLGKMEADFAAVKEMLQGDKIKEANDALKALKDQMGGKKEEAASPQPAAQPTQPPAPQK